MEKEHISLLVFALFEPTEHIALCWKDVVGAIGYDSFCEKGRTRSTIFVQKPFPYILDISRNLFADMEVESSFIYWFWTSAHEQMSVLKSARPVLTDFTNSENKK
ncbi:hypothetical protein DRQ36_09210 [bacterium]|nr:MAG: hypothetical protein DRQ36_09210 [bacterium]